MDLEPDRAAEPPEDGSSTGPNASRSPLRVARRRIGRAWSRLPRRLQPPRLRRRSNWAIGILGGADPFELGRLSGVRNPVIDRFSVRDLEADYVADPFLFRWDDRWFLFFEVLHSDTGLGRIAVASSSNLRQWRYEGVVLREPHHLSYPYALAIDGVPHLVVESSEISTVRAYRAVDFPRVWEPAADLLTDASRVDPTLVEHEGTWWLFTGRYRGGGWRQLDLHGAPHPLGPYQPHPSSPVVTDDARIARPAGRIVRDGGRLLRFGQDCTRVYGERVWAVTIEKLGPRVYRERAHLGRPLLAGTGRGWNHARMHHIDLHRLEDESWIAAVDGW